MRRILLLFAVTAPLWAYSQQVADTTYAPVISHPEYQKGQGPVVFIDEGHHNFHTKNGRYKAFATLLERDGYKVKEYPGLFVMENLAEGKILVISNALNKANVDDWFLPTPSAFTSREIEVVRQWVSDGGSLFLIADHMPLAGAATDLASVFGFRFSNGFALDTTTPGPSIFKLDDKTLIEGVITRGRKEQERVEQVASFTGQAFQIPDDATPLLVFNRNYTNFLPDTAWVFNDKTLKYSVEGWSQGACKAYGKGRIVVFGEAAMFTAQLAGQEARKVGMNSPDAPQNYQFLLNIIHWLDRKM